MIYIIGRSATAPPEVTPEEKEGVIGGTIGSPIGGRRGNLRFPYRINDINTYGTIFL